MKPCSCDPKFNLPMNLCDDAIAGPFWVECDFCGNKTAKCQSDEIAEFKWNEFQHKRGQRAKELPSNLPEYDRPVSD